ncbi:MAG TPA: cell division protein FtsA, partial [Nitrospirae bacterium]|nr:cell division protein FtsA [Nitrospirota bacterium]
MKKGNLVVGLDVGTTKICAVVGEVNPIRTSRGGFFSDGANPLDSHGNGFLAGGDNGNGSTALNRVDIVGVGSAPSKGLRKGVVVNIESTVESIKKAVEEAETMAGIDIKAVHVGIAGGHVSSFQSNGVIAIKEKDIGRQEMDKVIDAARAVAIPLDREVLHVMPIGFVVDGQNGISDPSGMSGVRLEANVRIITGAVTSVQNLVKSCQRAGLDVLDIVLEPLASAEAALSRDEKDVGAGIVDI